MRYNRQNGEHNLFVSVVAFFDCICVSGNTVMRIEMETLETGNIIKEWE